MNRSRGTNDDSTNLQRKFRIVRKTTKKRSVKHAKDYLTPLPMDLKLKIVSLLTRSETLSIASCSSGLKRDFTSNEVWKLIVRQFSRSLLSLPMRRAKNWRDKFRVFLGESLIEDEWFWERDFNLHYLFKIDGLEYFDTLGNSERGDLDSSREFLCFSEEHDFGSNIPYDRARGSLMLFLTYKGMTSVLLEETNLSSNSMLDGYLLYIHIHDFDGIYIEFRIQFTRSCLRDPIEAASWDDEIRGISGIESILFSVEPDDDNYEFDEPSDVLDIFITERLRWY